MRKGIKRKASQKSTEEASEEPSKSTQETDTVPNKSTEETDTVPNKSTEETNKEPKKGSKRTVVGAKRVKLPKPESEPEFFPETRNLEDLWQKVFPVGTEWDQLDTVYQYKWNFSNLETAFEEGGELYGKTVYLFGCTEPQRLIFGGRVKVTFIPVVVAVVSPVPPSDRIGITSVQSVAEEIVPMKQMKMDWVPYIPLENRDAQVERLKSQIFILSCTQRRAGLKHLKTERLMRFEYCLPYFYHPLREDESEQSTIVHILFPAEPPVICEFDWELDELQEFTDKLVEVEALSEDQKDAFKDFVKEKVRERKKANREAREARKKARDAMDENSKVALENTKFYKFYPVPTPDTPDVSKDKDPFINRYYGKADMVL